MAKDHENDGLDESDVEKIELDSLLEPPPETSAGIDRRASVVPVERREAARGFVGGAVCPIRQQRLSAPAAAGIGRTARPDVERAESIVDPHSAHTLA